MKLVLSSSSLTRQNLLHRLQIPFEIARPNVDEAVYPEEHPSNLVIRLAITKAQAVSESYPESLIIGCDQIALLQDKIINKPLSPANAFAQLQAASGKQMQFLTGLCVLNTKTGSIQTAVDRYEVIFRQLTNPMIENYLQAEQPYQCAGSFKAEGLGIALFQEMHGNDFTTLLGLPLITLINLLEKEGIRII